MWILVFMVCTMSGPDLSCEISQIPGYATEAACYADATAMNAGVGLASAATHRSLYVQYECQSALAS